MTLYQWDQVSSPSNTANPTITISTALTAGDVYLVIDAGVFDNTSQHGTALSGLGVSSWTRITAAQTQYADAWVGTGASNLSSGQVLTLTSAALPNYYNFRRILVYCFRGLTATTSAAAVDAAAGVTGTTADVTAGSGQAVVAYGISDTTADSLKNLVPTTGWATIESPAIYSTFPVSHSYREPSSSEAHRASASRAFGTSAVHVVRLGDSGAPPLSSSFVGWGNPIF